jgi:hypothetical protein
MAVIRREDGVQFAVQSYRELMKQTNPGLLKNELRLISKTNGEFVRLFKQQEDQYEAVFSREPGYLLGETVWYYFGKPANLIYCEALPDGINAILVIVRAGTVYLDAKLPLTGLRDEFLALATGSNRYVIHVYGDIPLAHEPAEDKYAFEPARIQSFNLLAEPLFPVLPAHDNLKLLPLEQAIKIQNIDKSLSPTVLVAIVAVFAVILYWLLAGKKPEPVVIPQVTYEQPVVQPQQIQAQQLQGPSPQQQLEKLADTITLLYGLNGWIPSGITFDGASIAVQLQSIGGGASMLLDWAKRHGGSADLSSQGARIQFPVNLANRAQIPPLSKEDEVTARVIDRMLATLPGRSVQIGTPASTSGLVQERLTITFSGISPSVLQLIGKQVEDLPVKMNTCTVNVADGLLSGQLELLVVGD